MKRSRRRLARRLVTLLLVWMVLAVLAAPAHAEAGRLRAANQFGRTAFDALILRPLGLVQTLVSATFFLVAYPVSLLTGGSDDVIEICIEQPIAQTFRDVADAI